MKEPTLADIADEIESWGDDAFSMAECVAEYRDRILAALRIANIVISPTDEQMRFVANQCYDAGGKVSAAYAAILALAEIGAAQPQKKK